jgi:hypothetical protein
MFTNDTETKKGRSQGESTGRPAEQPGNAIR